MDFLKGVFLAASILYMVCFVIFLVFCELKFYKESKIVAVIIGYFMLAIILMGISFAIKG